MLSFALGVHLLVYAIELFRSRSHRNRAKEVMMLVQFQQAGKSTIAPADKVFLYLRFWLPSAFHSYLSGVGKAMSSAPPTR